MKKYIPFVLNMAMFVAVVLQAITVSKMKSNVDKSLGIAKIASEQRDAAIKNADEAIRQAKIAQDNSRKLIDLNSQLLKKLAVYEKEYGAILMPGESMSFEVQIPIH